MTGDVRDLFPLYAVGAVDADERRAVEAAIAADPALAAELAAYEDAAGLLASAAPAVRPGAHVKARLMTAVGAGRFEPQVSVFAKLFDVAVERAREMLGWIDNPRKWVPSGLPGVMAVHFAAGPACAGADTGYLELQPGAVFAFHEHVGEETTLVLAGTIIDGEDGRAYRPGDVVVKAPGTRHDFRAGPDEVAISAVRAFGVRYGLVKPNDE
jgi:anti-sigma factor ChrR (cupin superfamily)